MSADKTDKAAKIAFSSTVASALARSARDIPLPPRPESTSDTPDDSSANDSQKDAAVDTCKENT